MTNTLTITTNSYDATIDQTIYTVTIGAAVSGGSAVNTENFTVAGGNTSGSDGTTGRVTTLANTSLSKTAGFLIFMDHQFIHPGEVTISHLSASSTITFDSPIRVWNGQKLTVVYYDA